MMSCVYDGKESEQQWHLAKCRWTFESATHLTSRLQTSDVWKWLQQNENSAQLVLMVDHEKVDQLLNLRKNTTSNLRTANTTPWCAEVVIHVLTWITIIVIIIINYFKLYNITTLVAKCRIDSFRLRGTGSMRHMFLLNIEFGNACRFRVFHCHFFRPYRVFHFRVFSRPSVDTDLNMAKHFYD